MRTKQLGNTDLELTVVGLGTWAMGGSWQYGWGPQDEGEAIAAILKAIDLGINWIDTAPIYGCGRSEELLGIALKKTKTRSLPKQGHYVPGLTEDLHTHGEMCPLHLRWKQK